MSSNLSMSDKALIETLRIAAYNDFYIFCKFVCEKNLMEEVPHRELCDFIVAGLYDNPLLNLKRSEHDRPVIKTPDLEESSSKLIELPRNSFKSTVAVQCLPLWLLWHNPNLRILIDCETLGNAKRHLAGLKSLMDEGELIREVCVDVDGNYMLEPDKSLTGGWTDEQVILATRTKKGLKEPSIFCSGVDNAQTGQHMEVLLMDDVVSEKNVTTEGQLEKVKNHFRLALSLLEPGGLHVVIGTRYHMWDLYNDLEKDPSFAKMIRPAIDKHGKLFFPTRLTREFLSEQRRKQGSYIFSSQYMLNPVDDSDAIFKNDTIQYYDDDYIKDNKIVFNHKYILTDPAVSKADRADFTVIMCVGVTKDNKLFVLEYIRDKLDPDKIIDSIFDMYLRHKALVRKVGVETVSAQKILGFYLKNEIRRRGIYMPLEELNADRDKRRRVLGLQPLFEEHLVFIREEHKALEQELRECTVSGPWPRHDDCVDALAYVLQFLTPGGVREKRGIISPDVRSKSSRFVNY